MNGPFYHRFIWGILLIVAGILFLLHQAGQIHVDLGYIFSTYWPLFIIYFALKGMIFQKKHLHGWNGNFIFNLCILFIGLFILGRNLDLIHVSFGQILPYLIPIALIGYGLSLIFSSRRSRESGPYDWGAKDWKDSFDSAKWNPNQGSQSWHSPTGDSTDWYHQNQNAEIKSSFFGDLYMGHDYWDLRPLNISHFVGDTILDLTKANIPYGETKISVSAFVGDLKVFVPNDMELEVSVSYSAFLGDGHVFDRKEGGLFHSMKWEPPHFSLAEKRIRIVVNMFIGDVKIQRVG